MQKGKKCKRGKNKIKKAAQWVNFGILLKGGKYNLWRGRGIVSGLIYMQTADQKQNNSTQSRRTPTNAVQYNISLSYRLTIQVIGANGALQGRVHKILWSHYGISQGQNPFTELQINVFYDSSLNFLSVSSQQCIVLAVTYPI